jgi:DNA-binding NarL/FixJ family response regulator
MRQENLQAVIAQAIGPEQAEQAARAVMREWGGQLQQIPKERDDTLAELKRQARELRYRHGLTVVEIAERLVRSESTVRRYLAQ